MHSAEIGSSIEETNLHLHILEVNRQFRQDSYTPVGELETIPCLIIRRTGTHHGGSYGSGFENPALRSLGKGLGIWQHFQSTRRLEVVLYPVGFAVRTDGADIETVSGIRQQAADGQLRTVSQRTGCYFVFGINEVRHTEVRILGYYILEVLALAAEPADSCCICLALNELEVLRRSTEVFLYNDRVNSRRRCICIAGRRVVPVERQRIDTRLGNIQRLLEPRPVRYILLLRHNEITSVSVGSGSFRTGTRSTGEQGSRSGFERSTRRNQLYIQAIRRIALRHFVFECKAVGTCTLDIDVTRSPCIRSSHITTWDVCVLVVSNVGCTIVSDEQRILTCPCARICLAYNPEIRIELAIYSLYTIDIPHCIVCFILEAGDERQRSRGLNGSRRNRAYPLIAFYVATYIDVVGSVDSKTGEGVFLRVYR